MEASFRRRIVRSLLLLVPLLALGGAGLAAWKYWLEDRFIPKRWGVVEEGLVYRSGQLSSALVRDQLERHGIRCIVDLTSDTPGDADEEAEVEAARALGIDRITLGLGGDGTGDIHGYAEAVTRMHRAIQEGEPTLVHCAAGAQRTGGAVAFYRLLVQGRSPQATADEMARYGWDPDDDTKLKNYINEHVGDLAALLVDRGVIERVPDPLPHLP